MSAAQHHNPTSSTTEQMKWRMCRSGRASLAAVLAAGLVLVLATTASAARPTRTELTPQDYVVPAGQGCAFDVQVHFEADYRLFQLTFSDGRVMRIGNGERTLANLDTGATVTWQDDFRRTEVYDAATNELVADNSGRVALEFWPGDVDHTGQVVGANGAWYGYVGHVQGTFDGATGAITSTVLNGWAVDLCEALS